MPASFPSSAKAFTTKSDGAGNTILAAHINDLQNEVTAIEQDILTALPSGVAAGITIGTWNPILGGEGGTSGQTYDAVNTVGRYTKIGRRVTVDFRIVLTAKGIITGNVEIQGLPFLAGPGYAAGSIGYWQATASTFVCIGYVVAPGENAVSLVGTTAAAAGVVSLTTADISNTTQLIGTISYEAAS